MSITTDKNVRIKIENKHLELLKNTSDYVLGNDELITAIEDANKKPVKVKVRDRTSEETKVQINLLQLEYRTVTVRAFIKFIVTCNMTA